MRRVLFSLVGLIAVFGASAQGPQGGAAGAQQGGGRQQEYDRSVSGIERTISRYLGGEEIKNILTPGEYSEWPIKLKEGHVVIMEARSDAFDPALELVDAQEKVLAQNDDRYPGDQRPLLLWRCTKDGEYKIRARCFQNKAGGQFFIRFTSYRTIDLEGAAAVEKDFGDQGPFLFLFRVPMKAGQIKRILVERPSNQHVGATVQVQIGPTGLPDIGLGQPLGSIAVDPTTKTRGANMIMAPVDGDYYALADAWGSAGGKLRASAVEIKPSVVPQFPHSSASPANVPGVLEASIKAGEFVEVASPSLNLRSKLIVTEKPDISKFDMSKPETNPFMPQAKGDEDNKTPAFAELDGRARDPRLIRFVAKRDFKLWIGTDGASNGNQVTVDVRRAGSPFAATNNQSGVLRVGYTDYWTFDAEVGDVMTFACDASAFSSRVSLLDPDLNERQIGIAEPDQVRTEWNIVADKPGRHMVAISCMGDGGGGAYSLSRSVFSAKAFSKAERAAGVLQKGQVQVWKFTATPQEPLLVRWTSSAWDYSITITDELGRASALPLTNVDEHNRYGVLKVDRPTTFLIVLIGTGPPSTYGIELRELPK